MSTTGSDPDTAGTVSEDDTSTEETADPKAPTTSKKTDETVQPDKKEWM